MAVYRLHPEKVSPGSISSIANLCSALDITKAELDLACALDPESRYVQREIPKKDGSTRIVNNPHYLIRKIQHRINTRIFSNGQIIKWPDYIFGSIPNDPTSNSFVFEKDYISCARQHCRAKSILSVDIKDFFNNITINQVESIFSNFLKYSNDVSKVLANICCKGDAVVQGALTSSYLATLCLWECEGDLVKALSHKGLVYTRLVDDITISSKTHNYDFSFALRQVEKTLDTEGLPLNLEKTKTQRASMAPMLVHGLRVDFKEPRLPSDEVRRIRASVNNLESVAAGPGYRASRAYRKDFNRCMGKVNKLQRVGHKQYVELQAKMRKILPLPSHKDLERAQMMVDRLMSDWLKPGYANTYWCSKRYFVAMERLVILARSFPNKATELKSRISLIRPTYGSYK